MFIQRAPESDAKVTVLSLGDGLFILEAEKYKHKAGVLTDVARVVFVEDV